MPLTQPTDGLTSEFAAAIGRLGPFEPHPALAIAVSGGADSMALALVAGIWARQRGGSVLALVVDHGLRPASAAEAQTTAARLTGLGIQARLLTISNLTPGAALAERARIMRYQILSDACRQTGILHLLLGHHAADQAETLAMRVLRGSRTHGLAGMAALVETPTIRLLRPLLGIDPARLRAFLIANGIGWIEDPSNHDLHALRPRLRHRFAAADPAALAHAASTAGHLRSREETAIAAELAGRATIRPEGFAHLSPGRISPGALSRLIRTIGGAAYPPDPARIDALAARPEPATIAGVRLVPAGRFAKGLLLVRETAAIMPPVPARSGTIWDHRFRLNASSGLPPEATIGKLGQDAARLRHLTDLPSVVLQTIPAIRLGKSLAAVPHLRYASRTDDTSVTVLFTPPQPAAAAPFLPAAPGLSRVDGSSRL